LVWPFVAGVSVILCGGTATAETTSDFAIADWFGLPAKTPPHGLDMRATPATEDQLTITGHRPAIARYRRAKARRQATKPTIPPRLSACMRRPPSGPAPTNNA
jgi:hypothetical protein